MNKNLQKLIGFILVMILGTSISLHAQDNTDICTKALQKCGADAIVTTLFAGPLAGLEYFGGCLVGYDWCLKYFIPFKK